MTTKIRFTFKGYDVTISPADEVTRSGWGWSALIGNNSIGFGSNYPSQDRAERAARLAITEHRGHRALGIAAQIDFAFGELDDLSQFTEDQQRAIRAAHDLVNA